MGSLDVSKLDTVLSWINNNYNEERMKRMQGSDSDLFTPQLGGSGSEPDFI